MFLIQLLFIADICKFHVSFKFKHAQCATGMGGGGGLRSVRGGEKVAHLSSPDLGIDHYTTITFPGLVYPSRPLDFSDRGGGGILVWGLVPQQEEDKFLILLDDMIFLLRSHGSNKIFLWHCLPASATYGFTFLCEQC